MTKILATENLMIEDITESAILSYFETLNAANFITTANLFAPNGILYPPFEDPVTGRKAIATYLATEALGMQLYPHQSIKENDGQFKIVGKVQTSLLSVNVAWQFILTPKEEIASVEVKLLASPQELLSLRGYNKNAAT